METANYHIYKTPFGSITIASSGSAITNVYLGTKQFFGQRCPSAETNRCATELLEYFSGNRSVFDLALDPAGTDFQKAVWKAIDTIPYGQTCTPKDLAASIGKPDSYRAVGSAVNANPIAVLIPAHRVVMSSGFVDKKDSSAKLKAAFRELEKQHLLR